MSGPLDTFPCPWCAMSYPAKPVLIGKPVRCKGCGNGFVLQPEGVASRIQGAPPPSQPETPPQVVLPEPIPRPSPANTPQSRPSERLPKRKSEQLEAARAQMAAQLSAAAHQAANSESVKREERKSERLAKVGTATPASGDGKRTARSAVLTGEGVRQQQELRLWWLGLGLAVVVILLLACVLNLRSSARAAVEAYAAPSTAEQNRYPQLIDVLRARAWLASAPSMPDGPALATDLADASFGPERRIALDALGASLVPLKGLRFDPALGLWLTPGDLPKVRASVTGHSSAEAVRAVAAARLRHVEHRQLVQQWALSDDDAQVLTDLLTGTEPAGGEPIARRLLESGELPDAVVVRSFTGRNGSFLVDLGQRFKSAQGAYAGTLLRFEGARWPIGWRVLQLRQVK